MKFKPRTVGDIIKHYSTPHADRACPTSFYSWEETQVMMKDITTHNNFHNLPNNKFISAIKPAYKLIDNAEHLKIALKPFQQAKIIGIDCETALGTDPYRAKVRLVQLAIPDRPVTIVDIGAIAPADLNPLRALLAGNALKIGHNLKFELMMLTIAQLPPSLPFFDTYLAYRVLVAGLKRNFSLESAVDRLLGIKLDKTLQTSDWSGTLTPNQLQYAATDAAILLPLRETLKQKLKVSKLWETAKLEFACLPAVASMELNGMLLDREQWKVLGDKLCQTRNLLLTQINSQLHLPNPHQQISLLPEFTETINPRSPKQVLAALQSAGIPVNSTNTQTLIPFAGKYPVIQALLDYRSVSTRISTFVEGLPHHIHPVTGKIHPNWFQIGARSGRFSCREPNLTNIPRDGETRQCFITAPGCVLLKADYSQIELRIMAKISGDRAMVAAYAKGEDLHKLTASLVLDKPLSKIASDERQLGKIVNFGLIYGMGVNKFKHMAQSEHGVILTREKASLFRKKFFNSYSGIKQFHAAVRQQWQKGIRESRTASGRRRLWSKESKPLLNEMLNHPIQGLSADITKLALAKLVVALKRTGAKLICVVHDEILLECPIAEIEQVKTLLHSCMVSAGDKFLSPIPCEVEIKVLATWGG
ncbi:MAG: DNA polymerase [Oscillatoriaceae cyanobacterium Prado104]|jgi:DNA polymerase-1|nr:DNA polymerase [Oscillatoriaceae cyanobacterium Prado104]